MDYLVNRGFARLRLGMPSHTKAVRRYVRQRSSAVQEVAECDCQDHDAMCFHSASDMLDFATDNWQKSYVTTDLKDLESIKSFAIRPFFLLLSIDAPLRLRFER